MRNLKKFLALALAMVMAFSLMLTVNAKDVVTEFGDRDQVTAEFKEAVDVLSGMKVFQGDEGGFRPGDTITRAEVAAIIYRMATGDTGTDKMDLYTTTHPFTDVSANDWFAGYVGYCWNAGYIKGTTATTFNPYDNVTGYEVLAMILRAMGYDANNEFTGANWIVNVSATAQQRGLLADVKTTHYGNTLHLASRRDVVASILFQAAQKDRVKYTPAFGYQSGDYNTVDKIEPGRYNDYTPLGKLNFGLTHETSIVLGNQATGEGYTLLGMNETEYEDANGVTHKANTEYAYPGTTIATDYAVPAAKDPIVVGTGTKLNGKTGLDLFGHKVKAWYDERDLNKDGIKDHTYAVLDKASLSALVHTDEKGTNDAKTYTLSGFASASKTDNKLGVQAQKAGFKVDLGGNDVAGSKAFYSDNFSRITGSLGGNPVIPYVGSSDNDTRVQVLPDDLSANDMYVLVSNNSDKTVDVIVAVNADVARITRKDTVSTVKTLTLGCNAGTNEDNKYSRFDSATLTADNANVVAMDSIVEGSTTTLGDKVAAWLVKGTNNKAIYAADDADEGKAGTKTNDNATEFMYYLDKLETTKTGTIQTYGADKSLTLTDGTVIEQSWFRYKITTDNIGTDADDFVVGVDFAGTETFVYPNNFEAGRTYTIALDNEGRWLGVTSEKSNFIYATFGDYEIGALGTGTIKYTVTGIDWDGNKVVNSEVTKMQVPNDDTATPPEFNPYADAVADDIVFPNKTSGVTLADGYNLLPFTKKDLGNGLGQTIGNQIQGGMNTAFMLTSDGELWDNYAYVGLDGTLISSVDKDARTQAANWTVTEQDAKNGFVDVYKGQNESGSVLLTNDTKFIVVSGTGTATLDAKVYNGLSEFLKGNKSATLATKLVNDGGNWVPTYKHYSYMKTDIDEYNRVDGQPLTGINRKVTHVIMSAEDVTYDSFDNLYFAAPNTSTKEYGTGVLLAGADAGVYQYELYNNGVKSAYFVDTTLGEKAYDQGGNNVGLFYRLSPAYELNGVTVYKAAIEMNYGPASTASNVCDLDLSYFYSGASNLYTATLKNEDQNNGLAKYTEVMNVTNAKVVDVEYNSINCTHDEIDSVAKLAAVISGNNGVYNGNIKVAITFDGVNVDTIYVTVVPNIP